uniref:t-SNARE coiled-coil homology domain-containing protein n=1 Tax=Strongyloides stercoralis TaxID=6248 RepID=A0AAF5DJ48_STRER
MHFITYFTVFIIFFSQFFSQAVELNEDLVKKAAELKNKAESMVLQFSSKENKIKKQLIKKAADLQKEANLLLEIVNNLKTQTQTVQNVNKRVKRKDLEGFDHDTPLVLKKEPKNQAFMKKIDG